MADDNGKFKVGGKISMKLVREAMSEEGESGKKAKELYTELTS